jgi:hypothetical protein
MSLRVTGTPSRRPRPAGSCRAGDRGPGKPDRLIAHRSPPRRVHMQRVAPPSAPSSKAGTRRSCRRLTRVRAARG